MLWLARTIVHAEDANNNPKYREAVGAKASVVGIILNVLLCTGKAGIGVLSGSVSIVADALNNLSDAASNIISLLGFKLAAKPADAGHPYGHGRYEYLASLMVAVIVMLVGVELAKGSLDKLLNPAPVEFSAALVAVLLLSIAVKSWMCVFNRKVGKAIDSGTLEAASVDSRNDVLTTGAVLMAAVISELTGFDLDGWMGLAVACFILWSGVGLIRDTIDPLLGKPASPELAHMIEEKAKSYPGILGVHDLMVHDYGPGRIFASLHAEVPAETDVLKSHEVIDSIEEDFRKNDNLNVVIHLDPIVTTDPDVTELRKEIAQFVSALDNRMSIHDLRIVPGDNRTNVIFDILEPYGVEIPEQDLVSKVTTAVAAKHPGHHCVITVDHI